MNAQEILAVMDAAEVRCGPELAEAMAQARAAVAALIAERDALLVIACDFDEVLREKGLRCECGELDCRTSRLDAALARAQGVQS